MSLLNRISKTLSHYDIILRQLFRDPRSPQFALVGALPRLSDTNIRDQNELMEQSILWNTPKHRKTIEKRTMAKYGGRQWGSEKLFKVNHRIRTDYKTGEYFELGKLAPKTYKKVMEETEAIKNKMIKAFGSGLQPIDKEVVVMYENEKNEDAKNANKLVVEMEKPRPSFFTQNLLQKARTSTEDAKSTTVRPTGLG